jgi:hypothetical protein
MFLPPPASRKMRIFSSVVWRLPFMLQGPFRFPWLTPAPAPFQAVTSGSRVPPYVGSLAPADLLRCTAKRTTVQTQSNRSDGLVGTVRGADPTAPINPEAGRSSVGRSLRLVLVSWLCDFSPAAHVPMSPIFCYTLDNLLPSRLPTPDSFTLSNKPRNFLG